MLPFIVSKEQTEALVATAAMRLGVSPAVWTDADEVNRQAALDAATADLHSEPGLQIAGRQGDNTVQLACVVQALHLLDRQTDPGAQERRRLQDGGVSDIQHGRIRESYQPGARSGVCAAARELLRAYRGAVNLS